jgi:D-glucosaminate-specific PTS system IIB component
MAKLALVRVDYRMVHGQVAVSWVKSTNATKVIVMNDETAHDKLQINIMKMSVGADTKLKVYPVEEGVAKYQEDKFGRGIAIVIFRTIADAKRAYDLGFKFKKLNVGQVPMEEGRRHAVATINLSDEEMAMLTELHDDGVDVYNNQTITDARYGYDDILNAMKA